MFHLVYFFVSIRNFHFQQHLCAYSISIINGVVNWKPFTLHVTFARAMRQKWYIFQNNAKTKCFSFIPSPTAFRFSRVVQTPLSNIYIRWFSSGIFAKLNVRHFYSYEFTCRLTTHTHTNKNMAQRRTFRLRLYGIRKEEGDRRSSPSIAGSEVDAKDTLGPTDRRCENARCIIAAKCGELC